MDDDNVTPNESIGPELRCQNHPFPPFLWPLLWPVMAYPKLLLESQLLTLQFLQQLVMVLQL